MNQSVQYLGIPATLHFLIILCNGVDDRSSVVVLSFHRKCSISRPDGDLKLRPLAQRVFKLNYDRTHWDTTTTQPIELPRAQKYFDLEPKRSKLEKRFQWNVFISLRKIIFLEYGWRWHLTACSWGDAQFYRNQSKREFFLSVVVLPNFSLDKEYLKKWVNLFFSKGNLGFFENLSQKCRFFIREKPKGHGSK